MKKRSRASQIIPAVMVAAATAIPAVTAAEILTHAGPPTSLAAGPRQSLGSTGGSAGRTPASSGPVPTVASSGGQPGTSQAGTTAPAAPQSYVGAAEQNRFGTVQATLVVTGNRITDVIITAPQDNPRSAYINSVAVPILRSETLQVQSANVDAVSGATYKL